EAQLSTVVRSDDELARWIVSGALRGIETLICWDARLTDAGATALADARDGDRLESLDLSWNHIGPAGAHAVIESPHLQRVTRLRLYHNEVGATGASRIAAAGARLAMLNLCGNALGDRGLAGLAAGDLHALDELALGWNDLASVQPIVTGPWRSLAKLNVRANHLGPADAALLLSGALPALRWLGIDENPLGDAGLAAMLAAPGFHQLEWLNLGGTELDDRAASRFAAIGPCALRELRLHDNELSPAALAAIRDALPGCEVRS
ncbi:MAG TPA: hypothetical protein VIU61_02665, partial [Kofleriaceae bacterium]